VRLMTRSGPSISTPTALVRTSPRWLGVLLANATVRRPPVMSSGFGAPVKVNALTPKLVETTVNSM